MPSESKEKRAIFVHSIRCSTDFNFALGINLLAPLSAKMTKFMRCLFCALCKTNVCIQTKVQTTMKKNNLNPAWKESFDFDWHGEEIVKIECWDHNKVNY